MNYNLLVNIFLDDQRNPKDITWIELPQVNWVIVRNYNEFLKIITENGLPQFCSLDHDLAFPEHYRSVIDCRPIDYDSYKEKTGYHACKWLIEYCLERKLPLPVCFIHTLNPVGRQNIQSLIDSYYKVCDT
jgi:hypothetical protein